MWRLSKIILNNFRPYRDKKTIEFSTDKDKRITIIVGRNGSGKTTLLNAITWCLYGEEYHIQSQKKSKGEESLYILNTKIKRDLAEVSVELYFRHTEHDSSFLIKRKQDFEKINDKMEKASRDKLIILYKKHSSLNWLQEGNPDYFIQTLLPKEVHDFYFFDGERLDKLFFTKEDSIRNIKETIEKLSAIDFIDNTIEHLENVKSIVLRNLKDQPKSLDLLRQKREDIENDINNKKKELNDVESGIRDLESKIEDIDKKLNEYKETKQIIDRRKELENMNNEAKIKLKELESNFAELLITKAIYIYCIDAIMTLSDYIENMYKQGKIPPSINPTVIEDLLNENECICGRPLSNNEKNRLYNILKMFKADQELYELLGGNPTNGLINTIREFIKESDKYKKEILDLQNKIKQKERELQTINDILKNTTQENISDLESKRIEYKSQLNSLYIHKGYLVNEIDRREKEKKDVEKELEKEIKKHNKYRKESYKLDLINNSIKLLNKIKEERKKEIKDKISEKTDQFFKQLIWKKGVYNKVIIDDNYNISVLDNQGNDRLTVLSAGEREILALSFIAAVRQVIYIDMPIIIDTPLARIDEENRENIAKLLPEYLKDTQMILLMTNTEYTKEVSKILDNYVGKKLLLNFNEEEENTSIEVIEGEQ